MAPNTVFRHMALCALALASSAAATPFPNIPDADAVAAAAQVPTGFDLSDCSTNLTKDFMFPAAVDYATFNGDWSDPNSTFLQQYHIIDEYWRPGGPILFWQGAENPVFCLDSFGYYLDLAKDFGAMLVQIEHRYFGVSVPHHLNASDPSSWDPALLKDLTLDNILQDTVALLRWIKEVKYPDARDSKILNIGGSYTGVIGTLSRIRYPDFFWATYVGGFPNHFVTNVNDERVDGWLSWTNTVWHDISPASARKLKMGIEELRSRFAAGQTDSLKEELNLCSPVTNEDLHELIDYISQTHMHIAQLNTLKTDFSLHRAINATLDAATPFQALTESLRVGSALFGESPCIQWQMQPERVDPFRYLGCTLVPQALMESSAGMIWGDHKIDRSPEHMLDPICRAAFGIDSIDGGIEHSRSLGLDQESLRNMTRTVFTFGQQDPTTAFSPVPWRLTADREAARNIWISEGAHGSEAFATDPRDPSSVTEARETLRNLFREWLDLDERHFEV